MEYSFKTIFFWEKKIPKTSFKNEKLSPHLDQWFFSQICEVGWLKIVSAYMLK